MLIFIVLLLSKLTELALGYVRNGKKNQKKKERH